jgi:hypothetical protein
VTIEYADIVEEHVDPKGLVGRFIMSLDDGSTFEVPFYFDGATRYLALHGIEADELLAFRDHFLSEAKEAWLAHRDSVRDAKLESEVNATAKTFLSHANYKAATN